MGQTCSACCGNDPLASENLSRSINIDHKQDPVTQTWVSAVLENSYDGCKIISEDNPSVVNSIVEYEKGETAIHVACHHQNIRLVNLLCQRKANIHEQSHETGDTPLHIASSLNDVKLIVLLLSWGADPNTKNKEGNVARDLCIKKTKKYFKDSNVEKLRKIGPPQKMQDKVTRDEIESRGNELITNFGKAVGCEVDEIALFIRDMDEVAKEQVWDKFSNIGNKNGDNNNDKKEQQRGTKQKRLLSALTLAVLRKKNKTNGVPDDKWIRKLNTFVEKKHEGKPLEVEDFIHKFHVWLYEIHHMKKWKELE